MQSQLALITALSGSGERPDNELPGGRPPHVGGGPIVLPPRPPGWPPVPDNTLPSGGAHPSNPIFLPAGPDNTLPVPPGTIWPPLNPGDGVSGSGLLLVVVIGADGVQKTKWISVEVPVIWPPTAEPK
jgi:hypothetical protein